jgi:mutator protein MutT
MILRYCFNKLVRSCIFYYEGLEKTLIIKKVLNDEEYKIELKNKLLEEVNEVHKAQNIEELKEEIADCYEVIDEILRVNCINKHDVISVQKEKKQKRGGFDKKIFIETIDYDESNPKHQPQLDYIKSKNEENKYKLLEKFDKHIVNFIITDELNRVYIQKRSPNRKHDSNTWELPGGSVEKDETFQDCIARELKEEMNLELLDIEKVAYQNSFFVGKEKCAYTVFKIIVSGWENFKLEIGKASEFRWIDKSSLELINVKRENEIDSAYLCLKNWFSKT